MPANPLLDPGNRILGWSTGDFSLYGAQPTAGAIERSPAAGSPTLAAAPSASSAPSSHGDALPPASGLDGLPGAMSAGVAPDRAIGTAALPSVSFHQASTDPSDAIGIAPGVPAAIGSSGFVAPQSGFLTGAHHLVADTATGPITPPILDSAAVAAPAALVTATAAGSLVPPVLSLADTATGLVSSATDHLADPIAPALTLVEQLADGVPLIAPSGSAAAVDGVTEALHSTVQSTTGTVSDLTGTAHAEVTDLIGGSDPAAGIGTLVGLVESEHGYEIGHAAGDVVTTVASGSIVDALAGDVADNPLIGEAAHDLGGHADPLDLHHGLG